MITTDKIKMGYSPLFKSIAEIRGMSNEQHTADVIRKHHESKGQEVEVVRKGSNYIVTVRPKT